SSKSFGRTAREMAYANHCSNASRERNKLGARFFLTPTLSTMEREKKTSMSATPLHILQTVFGYAHFRGHQQAIVEHMAEGGDALVLMPTGGGKSLCYQIPALLRQGTGIVVSPLIALM